MGLEGVLLVLDRRDAALGPVGRGVRGALLGHDRDADRLGGAQGVEEPGDAAAEDEDVVALGVVLQGGGVPVSPG